MTTTEVARTESASAATLERFAPGDWLLLTATALTWGSSFVWIEVGLETFEPALITLLRISLGALTLSLFRSARKTRVERKDIAAIVWLGVLWMGAPLLLFPIAQRSIDSSLAGMINGGVPVFTALTAALILKRRPPRKTLIGIAIGFAGIVTVGWPAIGRSSSTAWGVALVVLATVFYGIAINIAVPLQQRYGSLPVLFRAQLVAAGLTLVPGAIAATGSSFSWTSLAAMVPLGCLGTGLAFMWMTTLVGRVGAARGSITIYFVPIVAILLGAIFRNEEIAGLSLLGTALVLAGAFLASRNQRN